MKILLLTHYYAPERGAPQERWSALVRRFVHRGHQVHVVAPAPHYPFGHLLPEATHMRAGTTHAGPHGETVHRVAFRPYSASTGSRLADETVAAACAVSAAVTRFGRARPDVVVATVPSLAMLLAGALTARLLRVPFVTDMRDAWPDLLETVDDWDATVGQSRPRPTPRKALKRSAAAGAGRVITTLQRRADAVVTTTDSFAARLRSRGIADVYVVRNGAHSPVSAPRSWIASAGKELRVLYAGTVGRSQGLATAVEAAALAHARGTNIVLRLVGTGAESDALSALATALHAPVEFVPQLPKAQVAAHHAWADTLLVSLRKWPGLLLTVPSKLYEAMSLGIHVSGSIGGEAAEIITRTGAGHVSPPGDAQALAAMWARLAEDRASLQVGDGGRTWVRHHACDDRLARDYERLLEEVARC